MHKVRAGNDSNVETWATEKSDLGNKVSKMWERNETNKTKNMFPFVNNESFESQPLETRKVEQRKFESSEIVNSSIENRKIEVHTS